MVGGGDMKLPTRNQLLKSLFIVITGISIIFGSFVLALVAPYLHTTSAEYDEILSIISNKLQDIWDGYEKQLSLKNFKVGVFSHNGLTLINDGSNRCLSYYPVSFYKTMLNLYDVTEFSRFVENAILCENDIDMELLKSVIYQAPDTEPFTNSWEYKNYRFASVNFRGIYLCTGNKCRFFYLLTPVRPKILLEGETTRQILIEQYLASIDLTNFTPLEKDQNQIEEDNALATDASYDEVKRSLQRYFKAFRYFLIDKNGNIGFLQDEDIDEKYLLFAGNNKELLLSPFKLCGDVFYITNYTDYQEARRYLIGIDITGCE